MCTFVLGFEIISYYVVHPKCALELIMISLGVFLSSNRADPVIEYAFDNLIVMFSGHSRSHRLGQMHCVGTW